MQSILEAIKIHSEEEPNKLCIADYNGATYSYSEYWELINAVASFFFSKGLDKKDCVVIESIQSGLFTGIALGIQLAGGVFVPAEKSVPEDRLHEIISETKAKFYVSINNRLSIENEILLSEVIEYVESDQWQITDWSLPEKSNLAEILFTTGTTGKSKGIMINHQGNLALAENISYGVQMKKNNIELIPVPINHSYGLRSFYASMFNGSSLVLLDGFANPRDFFIAIDKYNVTSIALVPAIINMMLRISKDYIKKYSEQLDYIQSGSAALSEDAKDRLCKLLPKSRLYNFYGSTESGRCCILNYNEERDKIGCIGKPAYNASFEIIGNDAEIILSSKDNIGRLACKGKMSMLGYWNAPSETKEVMVNEYILTNDLCYIEDGYIYYVGRKGDVINVGGNKVSPMEIEEVANSFSDIQESVCIPIKDELLGQAPKLYVVLNDGIDFDKLRLIDYLSESLEEFKIPKGIEVIQKIPRMYNGKIDRKSLYE